VTDLTVALSLQLWLFGCTISISDSAVSKAELRELLIEQWRDS